MSILKGKFFLSTLNLAGNAARGHVSDIIYDTSTSNVGLEHRTPIVVVSLTINKDRCQVSIIHSQWIRYDMIRLAVIPVLG